MAPRQGGNLIAKAFKQFFKQIESRKQEKVTVIGEDHLGNRYFEAERPNSTRRFQRYFEKKDPIDLNQIYGINDISKVPPAWDAWLRFRRDNPPSELEIRESEEYFNAQQAMAASKKAPEADTNSLAQSDEESRNALKKRPFPNLPYSRELKLPDKP